MELLRLNNDGLSLELGSSEVEAVLARLSGPLGFSVREHASYDEYVSPGAETFSILFMNDWEDPCLIAMSPAAHPTLRALADDQLSSGAH